MKFCPFPVDSWLWPVMIQNYGIFDFEQNYYAARTPIFLMILFLCSLFSTDSSRWSIELRSQLWKLYKCGQWICKHFVKTVLLSFTIPPWDVHSNHDGIKCAIIAMYLHGRVKSTKKIRYICTRTAGSSSPKYRTGLLCSTWILCTVPVKF